MSYPDHRVFDLPTTVLSGVSAVLDLSQTTDKGFSILRDGAAAFVGDLEGSVLGDVWTILSALAASAQGSVADEYNFFRLNISSGGAEGATTRIAVCGKIIT